MKKRKTYNLLWFFVMLLPFIVSLIDYCGVAFSQSFSDILIGFLPTDFLTPYLIGFFDLAFNMTIVSGSIEFILVSYLTYLIMVGMVKIIFSLFYLFFNLFDNWGVKND